MLHETALPSHFFRSTHIINAWAPRGEIRATQVKSVVAYWIGPAKSYQHELIVIVFVLFAIAAKKKKTRSHNQTKQLWKLSPTLIKKAFMCMYYSQ